MIKISRKILDWSVIVMIMISSMPVIAQNNNIQSHTPLNAISPDTLRTFVEVIDTVRKRYAGNVDDEQLFYNAMKGILSNLDGHAELLDKTAFDNLHALTMGQVAGVGMEVNYSLSKKNWVVALVAPNSTAQKAGIQVGDYIHEINHKKLGNDLTDKDIKQLLAGIAGTQIDVSFSHAGRQKKQVTLQRTTLQSDQISVSKDEDIVSIKIPVFTDKTRSDIIEKLVLINTPIKGVIIDVRDNPGGVLSSAISVASLFVDNAPVITINEKGRNTQVLSTQGDPVLKDMPVVLLQNRYSASAAEVLALALQGSVNVVVAGEPSYGKGSVQSVMPINDNYAIKLTTAHYESVSGMQIDGVGIMPSIFVDFNDSNWHQTVIDDLKKRQLKDGMILSLPSDY